MPEETKKLKEDIKQLEEIIAMLIWQVANPQPEGIKEVTNWIANNETIWALEELQKEGKFPTFEAKEPKLEKGEKYES